MIHYKLQILSFLILMSWYLLLMFFLWLIFGSLGSVVMTRFAGGVTRAKLRGFFFGRSECPDCKHRLCATDLIPVVSYFVQWGKCRYCGKKISRIYPVMELLCAWIFVLTYLFLKDFWTSTLIFWLITNWLLILLLIYDLQNYELHMIVRILLMIVWILANIFTPWWNMEYSLWSVLLFGGIFVLIYLFGKRYAKKRFHQIEGFGQGDVYLSIIIWIFIPIVLSFHNLALSRIMLVNTLILFIILSSILWLIRALFQLLAHSKFKIKNLKLNIVPFFPAMIIAFRFITWKLSFFISLLFPVAW